MANIETIKKLNRMENKIKKINEMEQKICYPNYLKNIDIQPALKEVIEQTEILSNITQGKVFSAIQKYGDFSDLSETIEAMKKVVKSPTFQAMTKYIGDNQKILESMSSSEYLDSAIALGNAVNNLVDSSLLSHITEIYEIFPADLIDSYKELFEQMPEEVLIDSINNISKEDISNIGISEDGLLTYENETYSIDEQIMVLKVENRGLQLELQEQKAKTTELELRINRLESENTPKKIDKLK